MLKTSGCLFLSFMTLAVSSVGFGREFCLPANAVGFGQDQGEGQTVAWIAGNPLLAGRTQGNFQIESVSGSLASVAGTVDFETARGKFTLLAKGSFDVASGAFKSSGPIENGSGAFANAQGQLTLEGKQDLETGRFFERISGSICWGEKE